jgi:hypothetical protein
MSAHQIASVVAFEGLWSGLRGQGHILRCFFVRRMLVHSAWVSIAEDCTSAVTSTSVVMDVRRHCGRRAPSLQGVRPCGGKEIRGWVMSGTGWAGEWVLGESVEGWGSVLPTQDGGVYYPWVDNCGWELRRWCAAIVIAPRVFRIAVASPIHRFVTLTAHAEVGYQTVNQRFKRQ